jgi:hypothetical protein
MPAPLRVLAALLIGGLLLSTTTAAPAPTDLARAEALIDGLPLAEWLGPLAPVALSPFFALACLSAASLAMARGWLPDHPLLHDNPALAHESVLITLALLALFTSLPRLTKVSKPLAQLADTLETYTGLVMLLVIYHFGRATPPDPAATGLALAGLGDSLSFAALAAVAALNLIVIQTVRLFFEFLVWLSPIPLLDALFELINKTLCLALVTVYLLHPATALVLNVLIFLACLALFRRARRTLTTLHEKFLRPLARRLLSRPTAPLVVAAALFPTLLPAARADLFCFVVNPATTDPAITTFTNVHTHCYDRGGVDSGTLMVFLPGTGGIPFVYQEIVREAARLGQHAIGLTYVNATAVNTLCGLATSGACHEQVRREILEGSDSSTLIDVSRTDSIEHRLIQLLLHLNTQYPLQKWGQYLENGTNLVWEKIIVAGHSQGGGHAGYIAKQRPVRRAVLFAAMDWWVLGNRPADWVAAPGLTPPEGFFGFGHYDDASVASNKLVRFWEDLGLPAFAPEHLVDHSTPAYDGSHMLMTDIEPADTNYHGVMITDLSLPFTNGAPVFASTWRYLLAGPSILPGHTISPAPGGVSVTFDTRPGITYQLQTSTNGTYTNTGPLIPGTGHPVTSSVPVTAPTARFRTTLTY